MKHMIALAACLAIMPQSGWTQGSANPSSPAQPASSPVRKMTEKIIFEHADTNSLGLAQTSSGSLGYGSVIVDNLTGHEIAFMSPSGSGITELHVYGSHPTLSPDGARIAYCSRRDTQYFQIYTMNADGTGQKRLTNNNTGDACGPAWSRDGKKIAFYAFAIPNPDRNSQIWVMDAEGSNPKLLMDHGIDPAWSPDARSIVYSARVGSIFQIYAMNSDGTNARRLTNHKAEDSNPAWSPDGQVIAYVSETQGDLHALYVMAADGSKQHMLAFSKHQDFCFPAWSVDGKTIAFTALYNLGRQSPLAGEEQPRCDLRTGEYTTQIFDSTGKARQITDSKTRALRPSYGWMPVP
jgi:Tol biopolymer transport system component